MYGQWEDAEHTYDVEHSDLPIELMNELLPLSSIAKHEQSWSKDCKIVHYC